ncbi:MAG TPA: hypothetical protein VNQ79_11120 [Blastocatellia bacterium]|nr:hypothetical protein [Blastocatellia bacterium]
MSSVLIPQKTGQGWVIEMPPEMAHAVGVAEGSLLILNAGEGGIRTEILPPPTPELEAAAQRLYQKYKDVFAELKRVGD